MAQNQNGAMYAGSGSYSFEAETLERITADDVARSNNRGLIPRFFVETRGREDGTFVEKEMVDILVPGDSKSIPARLVDDSVRKRFPEQYKNWKAGLVENLQGTPIELLVGNGSVMHSFKAKNIFTIEQLSALHDGALEQLGLGGRDLRDKARRILEVQGNVRKQQDEDDKDRRIALLEKTINEMKGTFLGPKTTGEAIELATRASSMDPSIAGENGRLPDGAVPVSGDRPPPRQRAGAKGGET